jgi:tetratricopeptide (TPR) repeat protein
VALAVLLGAVKQLRIYLVPLLVFAAALLPTLGLVPFNFQVVSTVADRYAYLALIGPALALSLIVARSPVLPATVLAVLTVTALLFCTVQRLPLWSEDVKLFAATLEVNPQSWKAMHNYASALDDRGRTAEAAERMQEVIAQRPDSAEAYNDLAVMEWKLGRRPGAVALMRRSVMLRPTPGSARNLAVMEEEIGNPAGRDEALQLLQQLQTPGSN